MTDNEIIKALECCSCETIMYCEDQCPFYKKCIKDEPLSRYALDIINRQNDKVIAYRYYYENILKDLERAHAEIERLKKGDRITVEQIKDYLQEKLDEWHALGDRKFEPENVWGYNFIMACFDDLERFKG